MRDDFERWALSTHLQLTPRTETGYWPLVTQLAWRAWQAALAYHDQRVTELLLANNREIERRRELQRRVDHLERVVLR